MSAKRERCPFCHTDKLKPIGKNHGKTLLQCRTCGEVFESRGAPDYKKQRKEKHHYPEAS